MNLNEKLLVTKRKYTDLHPSHVHSTHAPVRSVILDAIQKNGGIIDNKTLVDMGVTKRWLLDNKHLIKMVMPNNYKLTDRGQKLLQKLKESSNNDEYNIYDIGLNLEHDLDFYLNKK